MISAYLIIAVVAVCWTPSSGQRINIGSYHPVIEYRIGDEQPKSVRGNLFYRRGSKRRIIRSGVD